MKKVKQRLQNGFTLIEVLIVVVIIGILVAIAVPTYAKYVKKGYASDAKVSIKAILNASSVYLQTTGEPASDVDVLELEGYLELNLAIKNKWQFVLSETEIIATSLADMGGGEGQSITYYVEEGVYKGYGQKEE
ncbi:MAG: prepilin-type N-terminal cleavage/methylation domain-containing protein [Candidatus Marinimicrobia bacterium]|nr:prepilin-type N-terminal cleavage/methylation domain-containing protein [Candidatus Neomarinimicrobiota bacterium]